MKYHKALGIPDNVKFKVKDLLRRFKNIRFSMLYHAEQALYDERDIAGIKKRLAEYIPSYSDVFEVVEFGYIEKIGFRISFNEKDIVFIVNSYGKIITLWTNNREDKHFTLRKEAYTC
jgi:hypothetical protein